MRYETETEAEAKLKSFFAREDSRSSFIAKESTSGEIERAGARSDQLLPPFQVGMEIPLPDGRMARVVLNINDWLLALIAVAVIAWFVKQISLPCERIAV